MPFGVVAGSYPRRLLERGAASVCSDSTDNVGHFVDQTVSAIRPVPLGAYDGDNGVARLLWISAVNAGHYGSKRLPGDVLWRAHHGRGSPTVGEGAAARIALLPPGRLSCP